MNQLIAQAKALRDLPTPERAKCIRAAAGITQDVLAEEVGVHRVTIARWEAGLTRPGGAPGVKYARLLRQLEKVAL